MWRRKSPECVSQQIKNKSEHYTPSSKTVSLIKSEQPSGKLWHYFLNMPQIYFSATLTSNKSQTQQDELPSVTSFIIKFRNVVSPWHSFQILLALMSLRCHEGPIRCCAAVSNLTAGKTFFHLQASKLFCHFHIIVDGSEPECSTLRFSWCLGNFHTFLFCRESCSKTLNYPQSTPEKMEMLNMVYQLSVVSKHRSISFAALFRIQLKIALLSAIPNNCIIAFLFVALFSKIFKSVVQPI